MRITHYLNCLFLSALATAACRPALAVVAEEGADDGVQMAAAAVALLPPPQAAAPARPGADLFGAPPLAAERLARLRGGTDTVSNDMNLSGTVANNTAVNVVSGMNTISNGSFSNASGLPVAIQNSGANVLIQNATIINVQLQ